MSLESWQEEFYPVKANKDMTVLQALKHTLLKYIGARKKNLDKHGMTKNKGEFWSSSIHDIKSLEPSFVFGTETCSLCSKYFFKDCIKCPIKENGSGCILKKTSPYYVFCRTGNPEPMIRLVRKLIKARE